MDLKTKSRSVTHFQFVLSPPRIVVLKLGVKQFPKRFDTQSFRMSETIMFQAFFLQWKFSQMTLSSILTLT